jgi:hypothetical protein
MLYLVILLFIILLFLPFKKEGFQERDYLVICAKYNKNTDFLKELSIPYLVIDKTVVPNVANEATTYLYYIINHYDSMPKNIIFIHDENESWHHPGKITENIDQWIKEYEKKGSTYYEFNTMVIEHPSDYHNEAEKDLWENVFTPYICSYKNATPFSGKCCAQFIVSKKQIRKHPKEFYEKYYDWLINNTTSVGNGSPDDTYSGHNTSRYAEWSWRFIFSP